MNGGEPLSDLKHDREKEYFRRREQELMEKLRRGAAGTRTDDQTQRPQAPEGVKPTEPLARTQIPWGRRIAAAAIASLVGVVAAWIWMTA